MATIPSLCAERAAFSMTRHARNSKRIQSDAEERIAAAEAEAQLAQTRAGTQAAVQESRRDVDRLRGELADLRTESRADRDQVRADHAAQLAEVRNRPPTVSTR